jgi:hypothetical protein
LKCIYNGPPTSYSFQDETQLASGRTKRRKTSAVENGHRKLAGGAPPAFPATPSFV